MLYEPVYSVKSDLNEISIRGLKAKVKTLEGKFHFLMYTLDFYINDNDLTKVKKIYFDLKKPENKLPFEISVKYSDLLIKMEQLVGKKDDKGFWEYSIFQKIIIPNEEQNIKVGLKPENSFDPKKINNYINPELSREEIIEMNFNSGIQLSNKDQIIYKKIIENKKEELAKDLDLIKKLGVKATPKTIEGKQHYIIYLLENFIKKNQIDNIANIYLKLKDPKYKLSDELIEKNKDLLNKMNTIVDSIDLIDLQFTKFYNQMPPLNEKGFNKFDDWQVKTIYNIDNNISTIISAPTSAGKTVLSGYAISKGKTLYIVPTDALAWQVASYVGGITNSDIPIVTLTYQSSPKRDELIKLLNSSNAVVGTPENILDFLPFIKCDFKWIIFDEIHMMGKKEGAAMESIAKILNNIPFIGLSATIGNLNELKEWFSNLYFKNIDTIVCDKRFFNLQKYFYDYEKNDIVMLNPLALISVEEFRNGSILNKTLNQTPQDTWSLVSKLSSKTIDLGNLDPYKYFHKNELIELTKTYNYFNDLIKFMVENFSNYENEFISILSEYSSYNFENYDVNLIELIKNLKINDKFPAIIFQQNTISCLELVKKLSENLDHQESLKYPNLRKERVNKDKNDKRSNKRLEKELSTLTEKQLDKKLKEVKDFVFEIKAEDNINAPHPDFIFIDDKFSDSDIELWAEKYKVYFPHVGGDYHYLIRLLWRGIGVYNKGLPDGYLRLVQSLASKKRLAVVLSDDSLVFGISMPFRSSIIYTNSIAEDNLDSMMYHQMAGRAGRRGLDKEGNVIFVGYGWDRIKELSISEIPNIEGPNRLIWTYGQANIMSSNDNYLNINKQLLKPKISDSYVTNFINKLEREYKNNWSFAFEKDKNLIQLMWMYRYSNECIIIAFLLPYLKKYFEICNPHDESKQVEIAYFLSKFINIQEPDSMENVIPELTSSKINYETIYDELNKIDIEIPKFISGKIWLSIRNNSLVNFKDNQLRQTLFDFSIKLRALQHYCYHTKQTNLTKLLGKLLTRIWWIYHSSSPIIRNN
jgi:superfamily II DNA or RNA helicase